MSALRRWCFLLLYSCSLLCKVVTEEILLEPLNATVLQGSHVRFNTTVSGSWQVMAWNVRGFMVLTVLTVSSGDIIPSSEQFSARFCSAGATSCVEFTIHNVTRSEAGPVTCTVQGNYTPKTAQLYVEETGTVSIMGGNITAVQDQQVEFQCVTTAWYPIPAVSWSQGGGAVDSSLYNTTVMADGDYFNSTSILKFQAVSDTTVECSATVSTLTIPQSSSVLLIVGPKPTDWTVLIAVVVSFGSCALLVLLVLGILFCYKKAKKPDYQEEMKRTRTQSQVNGGQREGQVNPSYVPEAQTSVPSSDVTNSGFIHTNGLETPDGTNSNQSGNGFRNAHNAAGEPQFQKHRHVTIV